MASYAKCQPSTWILYLGIQCKDVAVAGSPCETLTCTSLSVPSTNARSAPTFLVRQLGLVNTVEIWHVHSRFGSINSALMHEVYKKRPCGAMASAFVSKAKGCLFESGQGHIFLIFLVKFHSPGLNSVLVVSIL